MQGSATAETEVQAETLTAALVAQSCRALALAVVVTAAAEAKKLRAAQSFARGGRMDNPPPPPLFFIGKRGSRRASFLMISLCSEFGSACITFSAIQKILT